MTWLTYEIPAGKLSVQIPPAPTTPAGGHEGSSDGAGFTPSLPLALAHLLLMRVIEEVGHPRDGVWYCTKAEH